MIRKTGLLITILLTAVCMQNMQLQSQAFNFHQDKVVTGKASAGVNGGIGDLDSFIDPYLLLCKSDKCKSHLSEARTLWESVITNGNEITKLINTSTDPKIVSSRNEIDNMLEKFNKLDSSNDEAQAELLKEQIQTKLVEIISIASETDPNLKALSETYEAKSKELDEAIKTLNNDYKEWQDSKNQKEQPSEPDQQDCTKQSMGQFPSGELIAWGIPGFGGFSIPDSAVSQKKDKNVSEKNASDKTIQSLKIVEENSEKVTQEEIGSFLQELDNPVASN